MAWNVPEQGVPYYKPVAPDVPVADNTAAKIISAGTGSAVQGFVQMAIARERAQLEQQQMLQHADLAAKQLEVQKRGQDLDYAANADKLGEAYYATDLTKQWHDDTTAERSDAAKAKIQAGLNQATLLTEWQRGVAENDSSALEDLKGLTPDLMKSNPGEFLVRANAWNTEHGTAQVGAVPQLKKQLDAQVSSIKVPYVSGAEYVTADGKATGNPDELQWRIPNPKNTAQWMPVGGQVPMRKLSDLYDEYQDPVNRQAIMKGIIAAGHGEVVHKDGMATPTLDSWANGVLGAFGKNRETPVSKTPPSMMKVHPEWEIKSGAGADDTGLPAADMTPANEAEAEIARDASDFKRSLAAAPARQAALEQAWHQLHPDTPVPTGE